jgi:hypothetical protein
MDLDIAPVVAQHLRPGEPCDGILPSEARKAVSMTPSTWLSATLTSPPLASLGASPIISIRPALQPPRGGPFLVAPRRSLLGGKRHGAAGRRRP